MNNKIYTLNNLPLYKKAKIKSLNCDGTIRRRLLDLGFVVNSTITTILISPSGGLKAFDIRGSLIALRDEDSSLIDISY